MTVTGCFFESIALGFFQLWSPAEGLRLSDHHLSHAEVEKNEADPENDHVGPYADRFSSRAWI